jgi:hypothetical protein
MELLGESVRIDKKKSKNGMLTLKVRRFHGPERIVSAGESGGRWAWHPTGADGSSHPRRFLITI